MSESIATSGLVSTAYGDAFVRGPPREGVRIVQSRLHRARILADELADYFSARRELENSYLKSLQKIAKRSFLSDPSALGPNFMPVYERLVAEIGEVARIHGDLERKIEMECELPMRNASSKGEWAHVKEHDDNLSATLKEIASLEQQLAKDQKKVEGASAKKAGQAHQKAADTERALRQTMELWEAESPFAFEGYQRIDAQRLELMKEVVAKFETAQSDAAQRAMQMTEQSIQITLNFDPQADMQEFVLKNATAKGATGRTPRTRPPPPTAAEQADSRNNGNVAEDRMTGGTITPASAGVAAMSAAAAAPSANGVNEFGRSTSIHSMDRQQESMSQQSTPNKTMGGSTLKSALTRFGRGRSNKNVNESSTSNYGTLPESTSAMPPPPSSASTSSRARAANDARQSVEDVSRTNALSSSTQATKPSMSAPPITAVPPQVDSEGFSIPPANRDRKPWEIDGVNVPSPNLMDEETTESLDSALAPKMTGMSIAQKPIAEDEASDQAALERMRSTLLTTRSPAMQAPQRRNTTRRDRRDVRNTTYNPMMDDGSRPMSTFGLPGISAGGSAFSQQASPSGFVGSPGIGPGRSQSIVSSSSTSNVGNATLDSVAASAPIEQGLNAQITERVNVVLNGRNVAKIMVVGEISISVGDVHATESVHLRIDSFEQLEKAAPNPQYLRELPGQPGEYTLDLPAVVRQSGAAVTGKGRVTLLKYQLHVPSHRMNEFVPLYVLPQWRCEDAQTSILINYVANDQSRIATSGTSSDAAISDVIMSVDITSDGVTNVMSKPTASYIAEQRKLVWRLNDTLNVQAVSEGAAAHKALARFQVQSKSDVRPIEVRWKLSGASLSTLGVSIVNPDDTTFGSVVRQLVSGKYTASP